VPDDGAGVEEAAGRPGLLGSAFVPPSGHCPGECARDLADGLAHGFEAHHRVGIGEPPVAGSAGPFDDDGETLVPLDVVG
jgi:hypothetical protein